MESDELGTYEDFCEQVDIELGFSRFLIEHLQYIIKNRDQDQVV